MKRMIFGIVSVTILAMPASGSMVRGTISDSATGAPISAVMVIIAQLQGEREENIDTSITDATGSYSFTDSNLSGTDFYIRTIASQHYFHSTISFSIGIDDTIVKNIKLKRISTTVSATLNSNALEGIPIRAAKSRLYLSGAKAGSVVDIYNLNGRLLHSAALPAGAAEARMPERIGASGCYQASIRANGRLTRGMVLSR